VEINKQKSKYIILSHRQTAIENNNLLVASKSLTIRQSTIIWEQK
jgi:hypothetical protein